MKEVLYLTRNMLTAENGDLSRLAMVLVTQTRIFSGAALREQNLTVGRESMSDAVEGVALEAGSTAPVSCPALQQDLPSLL